MKSINAVSNIRENLDQSVEFRRFLTGKKSDASHESEKLEHEIETLLAEIDSKRKEQGEQDDIVARCDAALTIDVTPNRPAPQLSPKTEEQQ